MLEKDRKHVHNSLVLQKKQKNVIFAKKGGVSFGKNIKNQKKKVKRAKLLFKLI